MARKETLPILQIWNIGAALGRAATSLAQKVSFSTKMAPEESCQNSTNRL